ncbi:sterol desaturase family protein [Undibacterium sp.]|jgi:sterol desaturase/sphingolipid hydroxylase (fatty acid hydroxylase superfamily)|uniref:sterol desaturase family protein n=1 Tax=Undibacterium sp. TaxID=1914977 RepID=UPI002C0ECEF5|nr:sterol desaturase family protein [Undibacterium sp.]HTD06007.1 sterol desaturase family protein [Undibacterium sp.]
MNPIQTICITAIFLGFGVLEILSGRFTKLGAARDDWKIESTILLLLLVLIQPGIFLGISWLGLHYTPHLQNALAFLPAWAMFLVLLVADDLTQYWWHRISHSPLLWPLHRAHHSAAYMSVRVVYRNNFFYYAMMPGIWISAVLIYLGFGNVYIAYVVLKMAVIISAHSAVKWDEPLYKIRALHPLMWVLERTISTPATHYAHHALTNEDGIGHYKGNFGNFLFLWDVLFGTALITRRYPSRVGLQDDLSHGKEPWSAEVFFPVLKSGRSHSALGKERIIVE